MQISRNTKSQTMDKSRFHSESTPDKQIKKTNKNFVNAPNLHKKLAPSPEAIATKNINTGKPIVIDQKSNSTQSIRIKGFQKLLYVKKCKQKQQSIQEIFQNYPFSNMDAFTFESKQLRNEEQGGWKAKMIEDSEGMHLIQDYNQTQTKSKYTTIEENDQKHRFNGLSVSIFNNGSIFEGIYHDGHFCGLGYELQPNGNTYIGTFKDGIKNGNGTYYWFSNNEIFSGQWHGGLPHGSGVYIRGDSRDRYEGSFSNGLKFGHGVQTFSNGDKYTGEYVNGVPQGYGEYEWKDGSMYTGDFKHGVRHGYGIWKDQNEEYQGSYRMDKKQGLGIYRWIGKQVYKGYFRDDFREDYGEFYRINKSGKQTLIYKGCWTRGKKWEEGKPDEEKVKQLYSFLDESFKIQRQMQDLKKRNQPKGRVGHKNCIPNQLSPCHH